ncbi:MAG: peptidoglycan DD-metalloendopeptidase family protein [Acidobacteria bacterium]|nr:peptidoglycan DD-metalloendopeptidase family protein [Acidobacteriota bacterium]
MKSAPSLSVRILAIAAIGIAASGLAWQYTNPAANPSGQPLPVAAPVPQLDREDLSLRPGDTLEALLERSQVDPQLRTEMIAAVEKEFDVRKFRAGSQLTLLRSQQGNLEALEYVIDPDRWLRLAKSQGGFVARVGEIPGAIRRAAVCGTLQGSLFESVERTGERPELALEIAEIFAWDLDFYRDPREGDEFCLLVEKKVYANGAAATYRRVLAAKYNNGGTLYDAYLYENPAGEGHYYSSDGQSLQAAFLRSPLEFDARISSHFSHRRLHPVLDQYRAHLGTDYAAPVGTPVQAVADGRVVFSGSSGGSGNLITLQHANGFETQYLHLSRRLVRVGARVQQGARIGLVGMSGIATGPHVDLRVRKNGRYMNWETLKIPRQSGIAAAQRVSFNAVRDRFAEQMSAGFVSATTLASRPQPPAPAR